MAACENCGLRLANRMQMGAHMRSCGALRAADDNIVAIPANVPVRPTMTLHGLCRRPPAPWGVEVPHPIAPPVNQRESPYVRDYRELQATWDTYVKKAHGCCDTKFWTVFGTVRKETATCRDKVLTVCKDLVGVSGHRWPRSSSRLAAKVCTRMSSSMWIVMKNNNNNNNNNNCYRLQRLRETFGT